MEYKFFRRDTIAESVRACLKTQHGESSSSSSSIFNGNSEDEDNDEDEEDCL